MTDDKEIIDVIDVDIIDEKPGRRGDGGVYLVVAEETEESARALRYAARLADANRGHVAIFYAVNIDDFQHWHKVEAMMRREMRDQAEKFIWNVARTVNDLNGSIPVLYIREGNRTDILVDIINEDMNIKMMVLGGGTQAAGPGPLVSHFTGKGLGRLRVPVLVVPGHIDPQKIDEIA